MLMFPLFIRLIIYHSRSDVKKVNPMVNQLLNASSTTNKNSVKYRKFREFNIKVILIIQSIENL